MRSTRKAPSMVEFDPRIEDEWITMEKERHHKRAPLRLKNNIFTSISNSNFYV